MSCISENNVQIDYIVADAPQRAKLLGMQQFNGKYGCGICTIPSKNGTWKAPKKARVAAKKMRTKEKMVEINEALKRGDKLTEDQL